MRWHTDEQDRWTIEGDANLEDARRFEEACRGLPTSERLTLQMLDLDVDGGPACAALVDAVRVLATRTSVVLEDAPQSLAHVLYRVGDLRRIELVRPRVESPTVA